MQYNYKTWNPSRQEETFNLWEKKLRRRHITCHQPFCNIPVHVCNRTKNVINLPVLSFSTEQFFYRNPYDRNYEKMKSLLSPNSASCVVSARMSCFPKFRTFSASPTLVQLVVSSQCFIGSNQQQHRQQIMLCSVKYFSARKPWKFVHYTRATCLYLLALIFFLLEVWSQQNSYGESVWT